MTVIAVDIDDTLYDFNQLARNVFVEMAIERSDKRLQRGAYCAWNEWRTPPDVTDLDTWMEVIERCHSEKHVLDQTPYDDAVGILWELDAQGYQLHFISTRSPSAKEATLGWLLDWDFPVDEDGTCLTCNMNDKLPQIRDARYLIDDRPKTLVQFVYDFHWKHKHGSDNDEMERKAFGLYKPYNAALTDVPGIKLAPNWKLLRQYMVEQGVLRSQVGTAS